MKKTSCSLLWIGLNCLKAAELLQGDSLLLTTISPGVSSIYLIWPLKDERLHGPWSHLVVFNQGLLVWVKLLTLISHRWLNIRTAKFFHMSHIYLVKAWYVLKNIFFFKIYVMCRFHKIFPILTKKVSNLSKNLFIYLSKYLFILFFP